MLLVEIRPPVFSVIDPEPFALEARARGHYLDRRRLVHITSIAAPAAGLNSTFGEFVPAPRSGQRSTAEVVQRARLELQSKPAGCAVVHSIGGGVAAQHLDPPGGAYRIRLRGSFGNLSAFSSQRSTGFAVMNISANAAVDSSTTAFTWSYWNAASFRPNCEAYLRRRDGQGQRLLRRGDLGRRLDDHPHRQRRLARHASLRDACHRGGRQDRHPDRRNGRACSPLS